METQAPSYRGLIAPLLVGFAAVMLGIYIWLTFGGSVPLAPQGYRVTVVLPNATDLYQGSDVVISGVKIGRVVSISRDGRGASVLMEVQPRYAPIRRDATVIRRTKSLLGEGYMEIAPGSRSAPPIPDGGELAASHIAPAQTLDDVLATFAPSTRRNLRSLLAGLSAAFQGRSKALSDSIGYAAPVSTNLDELFNLLQSQRGDLSRLFSGSADVLTAIAGREALLQAAVTSGRQVLSATAQSASGLQATIRALPPFLTRLHGASDTISGITGDLRAAVSSLTPVAPKLDPALLAVDGAVPEFKGLFAQLPTTIAAGDKGLPAVSAVADAAGSSLAKIYPVTRQLVPTLQLLAVLRGSLSSFFANLASFTNGRVFVGGAIQTAIGGVPSVWNETLAGWKVRLPTNRPNPYPKPGEPLDIGHGGLLAYDCRQISNPLYLPATGLTGSPPCRLQGPWTFNGITADYPRPGLASP